LEAGLDHEVVHRERQDAQKRDARELTVTATSGQGVVETHEIIYLSNGRTHLLNLDAAPGAEPATSHLEAR
jgi:hypothetical protein